MNNEIEAQFLDIDKTKIQDQLKRLGATLVKPEILMKRTVFNLGKHSFARVRDEGDKIVMTYKNVSDSNSILGTKEVNVEVDNYDNAVLFLCGCGLEIKAQQETLREIWTYDDTEICIDTWPWLPTFVEIESSNEARVWQAAAELGLDRSKAKFGSVDTTYQHYYGINPEVINLHTPVINFKIDPPEWAKAKEN